MAAAAAARFLWILLEFCAQTGHPVSVSPRQLVKWFVPFTPSVSFLSRVMVCLGNSNTYKAALFFILSLNVLL